MTASLGSIPKISSRTSSSPVVSPSILRRGIFILFLWFPPGLLHLAQDHECVRTAGHTTAYGNQVALGIHHHDSQARLGDDYAAHMSGAARALQHTARRRRCAAGAGRALP